MMIDELLNRLRQPIIPISTFEKILNDNAKKHGYIDHNDFLRKTGWQNRFEELKRGE